MLKGVGVSNRLGYIERMQGSWLTQTHGRGRAVGTRSGPAGTVNRKTVLFRTAIAFVSQVRKEIVRNVSLFQAHSIVFRHIPSQEGGKRA
jgi:hypothetical protein